MVGSTLPRSFWSLEGLMGGGTRTLPVLVASLWLSQAQRNIWTSPHRWASSLANHWL